jgi:hypothetical protein
MSWRLKKLHHSSIYRNFGDQTIIEKSFCEIFLKELNLSYRDWKRGGFKKTQPIQYNPVQSKIQSELNSQKICRSNFVIFSPPNYLKRAINNFGKKLEFLWKRKQKRKIIQMKNFLTNLSQILCLS